MKRTLATVAILFCVLFPSQDASTQVPQTFSYQGVLTENDGSPKTGPVELRFELFDSETGGTSVWGPETHLSTTLEDGVFSVILGSPVSGTAVPLDAAFDATYWLEISVDGIALSSRVQLTAVPYALNTANSHSHDGEGGATFIGGGTGNSATGQVATVGGGQNNAADGQHSTIAGGFGNTSNGQRSTVGGGFSNTSEGKLSTVAGGNRNSASDYAGTVGGGQLNVAGVYATVPGGADNSAEGQYSLAAGRQAKIDASHSGTFVWADNNAGTAEDFSSTGTDQFLIRAQGGVGIGKNDPQSQLDVEGTVTATGFQMTTGALDGYILTSDASGAATWQAASSGGVATVNGLAGGVTLVGSGDVTVTENAGQIEISATSGSSDSHSGTGADSFIGGGAG